MHVNWEYISPSWYACVKIGIYVCWLLGTIPSRPEWVEKPELGAYCIFEAPRGFTSVNL